MKHDSEIRILRCVGVLTNGDNCSATLYSGHKFCGACGSCIADMFLLCDKAAQGGDRPCRDTNCARQIPVDFQFCHYCGTQQDEPMSMNEDHFQEHFEEALISDVVQSSDGSETESLLHPREEMLLDQQNKANTAPNEQLEVFVECEMGQQDGHAEETTTKEPQSSSEHDGEQDGEQDGELKHTNRVQSLEEDKREIDDRRTREVRENEQRETKLFQREREEQTMKEQMQKEDLDQELPIRMEKAEEVIGRLKYTQKIKLWDKCDKERQDEGDRRSREIKEKRQRETEELFQREREEQNKKEQMEQHDKDQELPLNLKQVKEGIGRLKHTTIKQWEEGDKERQDEGDQRSKEIKETRQREAEEFVQREREELNKRDQLLRHHEQQYATNVDLPRKSDGQDVNNVDAKLQVSKRQSAQRQWELVELQKKEEEERQRQKMQHQRRKELPERREALLHPLNREQEKAPLIAKQPRPMAISRQKRLDKQRLWEQGKREQEIKSEERNMNLKLQRAHENEELRKRESAAQAERSDGKTSEMETKVDLKQSTNQFLEDLRGKGVVQKRAKNVEQLFRERPKPATLPRRTRSIDPFDNAGSQTHNTMRAVVKERRSIPFSYLQPQQPFPFFQASVEPDLAHQDETHTETVPTPSQGFGDEERGEESESGARGSSGDEPVECEQSDVMFCPVGYNWQKKKCPELNIAIKKANADKTITLKERGKPCDIREIEDDGNCFFRCISTLLTGDEDDHQAIRKMVVDHMEKLAEVLEMYLPEGVTSMADYIKRTHMRDLGKWATLVEIYAAAHLLGTVIYVYASYGDQYEWMEHSPSDIDGDVRVEGRAVYIQHREGVHFEIVLDVD